MDGQLARVLARDIIKEDFGLVSAEIFDIMVGREDGTILEQDFGNFSSQGIARRVLRVFWRHSLLRVSSSAPTPVASTGRSNGRAEPVTLAYSIKLPTVIGRLHFAEYGEQARELFGDTGAIFVEELAVHGQLKESELLEAVSASSSSPSEVFRSMVAAGYIRRAQPWSNKEVDVASGVASSNQASHTTLVSKDGDSATTVKRKRKESTHATANASKRGHELPPEMRFMLQDKRREKAHAGKGTKATAQQSRPRAKNVLSGPNTDSADALWSLNTVNFDIEFKKDICSRLVFEKFGRYWQPQAIFRSMLSLSASNPLDGSLQPVTVQGILDEMNKNTNTAIDMPLLIQYLHMLTSDSIGIVTKVSTERIVDSQSQFMATPHSIIASLKERTMQSILTERYLSSDETSRGVCSRIYAVLRKVKFAEENQVAELAMIPPKEARAHLYKMYQDNYLTYQEVPKNDNNPEKTIFLWCIKSKNEVVVSDIIKVLVNLRQREHFEVSKNCNVVGLDDDQVEAARHFWLIRDQLEHASVNMCRMLRLFQF